MVNVGCRRRSRAGSPRCNLRLNTLTMGRLQLRDANCTFGPCQRSGRCECGQQVGEQVVMLIARPLTSLAFTRPGISPRNATSRIFTRKSKFAIHAGERPVIAHDSAGAGTRIPWHRLQFRLCGGSVVRRRRGLRICSLRSAAVPHTFFDLARRRSRSTMLVFAIALRILLLPEREVESLEQCSP